MQATTTVSGAAGRFFRDLKSFARDAESSCRDLKTNLERPALSASEEFYLNKERNSAQILVESIALQVDDLSNDVDQLSSCQGFNSTTSHLSLEALYFRCLAVYEKNEELKEELEIKLEQYSYQRKDPTKQKTALQQPSKLPQPSKIPVKSSSQSSVPKPSLSSSTTNKSSIPNASNATNTNTNTNTTNVTNTPNLPSNTSTTTQPAPSQPLSVPDTKQPEPHTPSPPHTPPKQQINKNSIFEDFPRTPTLDDMGISASALELIAKDPVKKPKKSLTKEPSLPDVQLSFTSSLPPKEAVVPEKPIPQIPIPTEKRMSNASNSSRSSIEEDGNFISERRKKTKKHRDKSTPDTLFPLMEEIRQEEYNSITPEYLKLSFSLELLNKAVSKINEHMTDKRFSIEDGNEGGAMESFTEADLRDDMEFGVKAKSLVLLLIQLKRIALDKRFGGTRLTILEKPDK